MQLPATPKFYFENTAGRLFEHPAGYVIFEYKPGARDFSHLQALLAHTRNLLERNQWHRMLGDQRQMAPFTPEESAWIVNHWLDASRQRPEGLFAAVILAPHDFAQLSPSQAAAEATAAALTYRLFDREEPAVAWLYSVA